MIQTEDGDDAGITQIAFMGRTSYEHADIDQAAAAGRTTRSPLVGPHLLRQPGLYPHIIYLICPAKTH